MSKNHILATALLLTISLLAQFEILLAQANPTSFINFSEVTELAKVTGPWDSGTAFGDFNNDGFLDFYLGNRFGENALFMNNQNGTFSNVTQTAGVGFRGWTTGVSWADFNNDGFIDLYVCNRDLPNILYLNLGNGTFEDVTVQAKVGCNLNSYFGAWGDYNNDGFVDIYVVNFELGQANILYRNNGDGTFSDVTFAAGVDGHAYAKSRGVAWGDYNNDGFLDLFVNNQAEDVLYKNNHDGTFTEVTEQVGIFDSGNGYGCAWGDYNNDGFLDLFVANNYNHGVLFQNQQGISFIDATVNSGLDLAEGVCGCAWGDLDNDGYLDLYLYNAWGGREYLFHNQGNGKFVETIGTSGITNYSCGNTASFGDYDNDGDLDLLTTTYTATGTHLYQNNGNHNNWLILHLIGTLSNQCAIGARAKIISKNQQQIREASGGAGYYSQDSFPLEFGLGQAQKIDSLIIFWPSGIIWDTTNVSANQILTIYEERLQHDMMIVRITNPSSQIVAGTIIPEVVIKNIGKNDEANFSVRCIIDSLGTIIYNDIKTVDHLSSLSQIAISFSPWRPIRGTEYEIRFMVSLANDLNSRNDQISKKVYAAYNHDIKMLRIISPSSSFFESSIIPIATIENCGYFGESLFDVTCEIYDVQSLVYRGIQTVIALPAQDTLQIEFGRWHVSGQGPFFVKFFSSLMEDENPSNDTLSLSIIGTNVLGQDEPSLPESFSISNVYPNPFNSFTHIEFQIPHTSPVTIDVYDLMGRLVKNIINDQKNAGIEIATWDARDERGQSVVSGVYLIRMRTQNFEQVRKVLYLK
ncbi:MAG: FG-GAP-like repeat-containing protein [candidate division KSB1 bacterium]|nr:FG-GAP-like repeat-containing protein [candidate division KSB1 bacterium]